MGDISLILPGTPRDRIIARRDMWGHSAGLQVLPLLLPGTTAVEPWL